MKSAVQTAILVLTALSFSTPALALRVKDQQVILDQLSDYDNCQSKDYDGTWCHDALVRWVTAHPADAFQAGKMTRRIMNAAAAMPFFAQAFEAKKGDCKDEDVKLAVVGALDLPADSNGPLVTPAKKIGLGQCYNDMKDAIVQAAEPSSYAFKNVCKELSAKGAITGLKKKKCDALT